MKNIFKILILILVGLSVTSCELLNWDDANRYREERGRTCHRDRYGNFYCEDTK